jgi:hypothetical protein
VKSLLFLDRSWILPIRTVWQSGGRDYQHWLDEGGGRQSGAYSSKVSRTRSVISNGSWSMAN